MKIINEQQFKELINETMIIDFYADWCGPCKMLAPFLEELAEKYPEIGIYKINVDNDSDVARKYGVSSIPTLVAFKGGKEVARHIGFASVAKLSEWIEKNLK